MLSDNVYASPEQGRSQPTIFAVDKRVSFPYDEPMLSGNSKFFCGLNSTVDLVENENIFRERMQKHHSIEDRYFCTICTRLLDQPVQIECGCRFCKVCIETYKKFGRKTCPSGSSECEVHDFKILFDKAVKKEMEKTTINCINNGCGSKVLLSDLYSHLERCQFSFINCQFCYKKILMKDKIIHETNECENKIITCPNCEKDISKMEYKRYHINSSNPNYPYKCSLRCKQEEVRMRGKDRESDINIKIQKLINDLKTLEIQKEKLDSDYTKREYIAKSVDELELDLHDIKNKLKEYSLTFAISSNFIWKVKEFEVLLKNCQTGSSLCYLSQPFYTNEIGYKLFLKIYPYGDGTARGTHLSIYVTIARGKYDELLQWPFSNKFNIKLLNQNGGNPYEECFKPNPNSQCYQRPEKEMNLASGNPKFIEHKTLYETDDFLKKGVLFIKLEVLK